MPPAPQPRPQENGQGLGFELETHSARVVFDVGAAGRLASEIDVLGCQALLVVISDRDAGRYEDLLKPLAGRVVATFHDIRQHVPTAVADQARALAIGAHADGILSIGGGSTTGMAKAVALTTGLPIIAVPTTYAGSEVTPVWGLTDEGNKRTGRDAKVLPRVVIYDPELTVALPQGLSVASGLNAIAHAVETFWAPGANPISSLEAGEAIAALARALPAIHDDGDNLAARTQALYGAYLAGTAFGAAGSGLHHKICHVLGGAYDLPHAQTHAIVLPHVLAFNAPAAPQASARIAAALGAPDAVSGLAALTARLGVPAGLRELGLRPAQLDAVVDRVLAAVPPSNPRPVSRDDVARLLHACWSGELEPAVTDSAAAEQAVTDAVLASFAGTASPRLRNVVQSLVTALHAFARDVRLTPAEWAEGITFLTRAGHITTETRQEFILLSDILGLSMLTVGMDAPATAGATESTVLGPFFVPGSPHTPNGGDLAAGAAGAPCHFSGRVLGIDARPVPGARVEIWEADEDGFYDVQYEGGRTAARGHLFTGDDGSFDFWSVRPAPYPIPDDGPVGDLLRLTGRSPMRPAHIHFMISAAGFRTLTTHLFLAGSPHLDDDAVFGVKQSLITPFEERAPGEGPGGRRLAGAWFHASYDFVLAGDHGTSQERSPR